MKRACLNQEGIAVMDFHRIQYFLNGVVFDPLGEFLSGNLTLESIVNESTRGRVEHIPHLGLAVLSFFGQGKAVVGMNLDGQIVTGIDELDQNREIAESAAVGAQHFLSVFLNVFI